MEVTMPRYELQPVTTARMANSNTWGSLYFCPCHGADQALPPADPATAKMATRQPPTRLPPQESEIRRFANPVSYQPLHFAHPMLQRGLSQPVPAALNSLAPDRCRGSGLGTALRWAHLAHQ